jgi:hypothetical protein
MIIQQEVSSFRLFREKLSQNSDRVTASVGSFILMSLVLGSLAVMHTSSPMAFKIIQLVGFFGLGYVHLGAMRGASYLSADYFVEYLLYTLLVAAIIALLLTCVYLITGSEVLLGVASGCAFLLPFFLLQTWFYYKHIPKGTGLLWESTDIQPDEIAKYYSNKASIRLKVSQKYFDLEAMTFPMNVSTWMRLGILFNQFAANYNKDGVSEIELADQDNQLYGWEFYTESVFGFVSRQLNPELDIKRNKVVRNGIIVARRVKGSSQRKNQLLPA